MSVTIPTTHIDLFQKPVHGVLTTLMAGGMQQSSVVWVDYDEEYVLINTTLERQKGRNMQLNPKRFVAGDRSQRFEPLGRSPRTSD
jgi:hypothetical protein